MLALIVVAVIATVAAVAYLFVFRKPRADEDLKTVKFPSAKKRAKARHAKKSLKSRSKPRNYSEQLKQGVAANQSGIQAKDSKTEEEQTKVIANDVTEDVLKVKVSDMDKNVTSEETGPAECCTSQQPEEESTMSDEDAELLRELISVYKAEPFEAMPVEVEHGNVEYKLKVWPETDARFQQLVSQLQFRLSEGRGEAVYELGLGDDGQPRGISDTALIHSLRILRKMAHDLSANVTVLRVRDGLDLIAEGEHTGSFADLCIGTQPVEEGNSQRDKGGKNTDAEQKTIQDGTRGRVAEVLVRQLAQGERFDEVRLAVVGNVDSGKSTILGVLARGQLDDGNGLARLNVFRHKHEVESGRTSDISREILGFDSKGDIINYSSLRTPTWSEICQQASKVVMFIDLAGHKDYLKTTVFGLTGNFPDYCMLMAAANDGIIGMAKEHYHLSLALKLPSIVVITKIDIAPPKILDETVKTVSKMLKAPGSNKMPYIVQSEDEAVFAARNLASGRIAPVFLVSNVTGERLPLLRLFLNLITSRKDWDALSKEPAEFHLDNTFSVQGVGTVVSGTLVKGTVEINQNLVLGPDGTGKFFPVCVKSIHTNRLPVGMATAGQSVSLALKKVKRSQARKGQVMVDPVVAPISIWEFDAEVFVITHSTTISDRYEAVVHCGCTRQTAQIVGIDGVLRAGRKGCVRFRFKYSPEYVKEGDRLIFREGTTKGIGNVLKVYEKKQEA